MIATFHTEVLPAAEEWHRSRRGSATRCCLAICSRDHLHAPLVAFLPSRSGQEVVMQLMHAVLEPRSESDDVRELSSRIEAEYLEMPGLNVTLPQAQRLWTADRHTCQAVFDRLIARGVLRMTVRGQFVRT